MNYRFSWLRTNLFQFLDIVKTLMLGILLVIAITLLGSIGTQTQETKSQAQQIKTLTQQNNKLSKQLALSNNDIKSHIDCIISFFGRPNRANLKIQDVCHFTPSSTPSFSTTSSAQPLKTSPGTTNKNSSAGQGGSTTGGPGSSGSGSSGGGSGSTPQPVHEPFTVLGIPTCVQLLKLCVSN